MPPLFSLLAGGGIAPPVPGVESLPDDGGGIALEFDGAGVRSFGVGASGMGVLPILSASS